LVSLNSRLASNKEEEKRSSLRTRARQTVADTGERERARERASERERAREREGGRESERERASEWLGAARAHGSGGRSRANSAHIRQSRPDYGLGFQAYVLKIIAVIEIIAIIKRLSGKSPLTSNGRLTDCCQVDTVGLRYASVNFGAKKRRGSRNW